MMPARFRTPLRKRRPGRPPGPSQAAVLRARLVEEASHLYADGGAAGLSFASVAARAGLTKPTVFHYFPNKQALLQAVFEAFGERLERAAETWFDPPPATHTARLERLVASLVEFYGRDPLNARILCHGLLEVERFRPGRRGGMPATLQRFVARFVDFIAAGARAGEFYADRPLAIIMAIGGIILFEFMLPDQGQQFRAGPAGTVELPARGREMAAVISRAVVRPRARLPRPTAR
jgi:AcrR family transcriptional regulator